MSNPIQFRYRQLSGLHLVGFLAVMLFVLITARFPGILLWAGLIVLVFLYAILLRKRMLQRRTRVDSNTVGALSRNELTAARSKLKQQN